MEAHTINFSLQLLKKPTQDTPTLSIVKKLIEEFKEQGFMITWRQIKFFDALLKESYNEKNKKHHFSITVAEEIGMKIEWRKNKTVLITSRGQDSLLSVH